MNTRTTAIGVFNHPLIRAIIENDIAKASEVNRLIVEEVLREEEQNRIDALDKWADILQSYAGSSDKEIMKYVATDAADLRQLITMAGGAEDLSDPGGGREITDKVLDALGRVMKARHSQADPEKTQEEIARILVFPHPEVANFLVLQFTPVGEIGSEEEARSNKIYNLFINDALPAAEFDQEKIQGGDSLRLAATDNKISREQIQHFIKATEKWAPKGLESFIIPLRGPPNLRPLTEKNFWALVLTEELSSEEEGEAQEQPAAEIRDVSGLQRLLSNNGSLGRNATINGTLEELGLKQDLWWKLYAYYMVFNAASPGKLKEIAWLGGINKLFGLGKNTQPFLQELTRIDLDIFVWFEESLGQMNNSQFNKLQKRVIQPTAAYLEANPIDVSGMTLQKIKSQMKADAPTAAGDPAPEVSAEQPAADADAELAAAVDSAVEAVETGQDIKPAAAEAAQEIKPNAPPKEKKELTDKIETEIGQRVAAVQSSDSTEVSTSEEQLEPLLAAYSNFENEFMDVRTLREQGNILVALMKALTEFEKGAGEGGEMAAVNEIDGDETEDLEPETKVDLRKSVEGIKNNMSSVLTALKQYKSKMFDIKSNDIKKVVVSALNNIQDELKRAYDALAAERKQANPKGHDQDLSEQVTEDSVAKVRQAYNTILSAVSEFYNQAQKGSYKVSFRDSTFAKVRDAVKGIQDYFPQLSPFSTGQSIDQITPQLSKVFMKLRPVMDEFLALSKKTTTRRDTINKFMERTKEVSLEINNLFGAETEITAAKQEIEAAPAAATVPPSEEDTNDDLTGNILPRDFTSDLDLEDEEEANAEPEEDEGETAPDPAPDAEVAWDDDGDETEGEDGPEEEEGETSDQEKEPEVEPEEAEEEKYNFGWVEELDIDEHYKEIIKGGPLRSAIRQARDGPLTEAMPKLSTLRAKAKGMVPSKFSFLAKTLDKFEIGEYTPKTLLKALKKANPEYVIALNLIPKDELEGYLKKLVGLKFKVQHKKLKTLDDWLKYGEYLENNAPKDGWGRRVPPEDALKRFFEFLEANANNLQIYDGGISSVKYDDTAESPLKIDLTNGEFKSYHSMQLLDLLARTEKTDVSLQEQITKLITPMIREQLRGMNG